ncbi:MAG: cysteine--tRNA ligase [Methanobacteriota archaeon]
MALIVYNTKTKRKEPFETLEPGVVRMYVCGPSVYDLAHIGHGRSYVAYDVVRRYLEYLGYRVLHVQNYTDISERISNEARAAGVAPEEFANGHIEAFDEDMARLAVKPPHHRPRASEFVPAIVDITRELLDRGYAYAKGGEVFFDVAKKRDFGKVAGFRLEDVVCDEPVPDGKRKDPCDFVLWRDDPAWTTRWASPWGEGRPGWHTECSAMSRRYLGPTLDIHGGGRDLIFPHHESSTAISEAVTGQEFCRYYLHNGFVTLKRTKMSKSMGNFVTLKELYKTKDAETIRFFLVRTHYREPIEFHDAALAKAAGELDEIRTAVKALRGIAPNAQPGPVRLHALPEFIASARARFLGALDDDFDTGHATESLIWAARYVNATKGLDVTSAAAALDFFAEAGRILGVLWDLGGRSEPAPA